MHIVFCCPHTNRARTKIACTTILRACIRVPPCTRFEHFCDCNAIQRLPCHAQVGTIAQACARALAASRELPFRGEAVLQAGAVSALDLAVESFGGAHPEAKQAAASSLIEAIGDLHSKEGHGGLAMVAVNRGNTPLFLCQPVQETPRCSKHAIHCGAFARRHFTVGAFVAGCVTSRRASSHTAYCGPFVLRSLGFRDIALLLLNFGASLVMAVLLGLLYMGADQTVAGLLDRQGLFFFSAAFFFFTSQVRWLNVFSCHGKTGNSCSPL